jgi:hypothetical protein
LINFGPGDLVHEVDRSQIRFGGYDNTCTQSWVTPEGAKSGAAARSDARRRDYVIFADNAGTWSVTSGHPLPTATPECHHLLSERNRTAGLAVAPAII